MIENLNNSQNSRTNSIANANEDTIGSNVVVLDMKNEKNMYMPSTEEMDQNDEDPHTVYQNIENINSNINTELIEGAVLHSRETFDKIEEDNNGGEQLDSGSPSVQVASPP